MNSEIHEFPDGAGADVKAALMAVSGAAENGKADFPVHEIEAMESGMDDTKGERFSPDFTLGQAPAPMNMLLAVSWTDDRAARDFAEKPF